MPEFLGRKEREALDKGIFGDPDRLLFPIQSAKDLETAVETVDLLPNALEIKQNIIRIAQKNGLTSHLPKEWVVSNESSAPLEFALFANEKKVEADDELGPVVIKKGKIFEANNYPDKKYGMTPEELLKAAKDFQPVGMNDSHNSSSLLNGKWGKLRSIKVADNGWDLEGEVAVPAWLDKAMNGEPIKVSAEWNRDTKKLEKLAYVSNPRVPDAAIYAAFMQDEIANDGDMKEMMTKWFEQRLGTKTPDQTSGKTAVKEKADTDTKKGKTIMGFVADFKTNVSEWLKGLPDEDPKPVELSEEEEPEEGKKAKLSTDKKKKEDIDEPKDEKKNITIVMSDEEKQEREREKQERQKLLDRIQALEDEKLENAAKQFAKDMVDAELAYPAEKSAIVANFIRASRDDKASPEKVKFSIGDEEVEGSRVESLKALYAVRRPHNLTKERLAAFGAGVLSPEKNDKDDVAAAKKQAEDFADEINRRLNRQAAGNKR